MISYARPNAVAALAPQTVATGLLTLCKTSKVKVILIVLPNNLVGYVPLKTMLLHT